MTGILADKAIRRYDVDTRRMKMSVIARLYRYTTDDLKYICESLKISSTSFLDLVAILDRAGCERSEGFILYHEVSKHFSYKLRNNNIYGYSGNIKRCEQYLGPSAFSAAESSGLIIQVMIGGSKLKWFADGSSLHFARQEDAAMMRLMLDLPVG